MRAPPAIENRSYSLHYRRKHHATKCCQTRRLEKAQEAAKVRPVKLVAMLCLGMMATVSAESHGATLRLGFSSAFSGTGPGGLAPWLTATYTDVAGGVQLDIQATSLAAPEGLRSVGSPIAASTGAAGECPGRDAR